MMACGSSSAGTTNDVATAAARVKAGVEAQAPGVISTAQAAATAVATQSAGAIATVQAVATAAGVKPGAVGGSVVPSAITDRARQEASRALGVPPEQLTIEKAELVSWRDSSLGCSEPGKAYAQVIVEGVRVVLSGGGKKTEVHADLTGGRVVVCQNPSQ
jgi:hypothetical protein